MITRFATTTRLAACAAFLFTLVACGGGGGGGGGFLGEGDGDLDTYVLTLSLLDSQGEPTNTVTSTTPATLTVRVTRNSAGGRAIADVVVNATTTLGVLDAATALTNAEGIATFTLSSTGAVGGSSVDVSADAPAGAVSASINYQVAEAALRLGRFENGNFIENEIGVTPATDLVYQGSAELFVDVVDEDGNRVDTAEIIELSSECLVTGKSSLDPESPLTTSAGRASTTYTSETCSGNDEITASIQGGGGQAFATLSIGSPQANSLTFVSAEPELIVLKGTGGGGDRQESSVVTFQAINSANEPLQGVEVNFDLSTEIGGLSLSPASAISDADGLVQVTLFSGDVSTVVRVIASVIANDGSGRSLSTVSDILTVSTGLPDQNSISLSVEGGFVIENGFSMDGITRQITVRMADKFNNPVPDGTSALFTTEYGSIDPSCNTVNGACSVEWRSQEPRFPTLPDTRNAVVSIENSGPSDNDLGPVRGGRSTILVTAIGEESFIDRNGNGIMDEAEQDLFENLPEAFIDHNEDGVFNPPQPNCATGTSIACISGAEETFVDFNNDNRYNNNNNPPRYNGLLCPPEGDGVWCSRSLVNVRDQTVLILSAGDALGWFFGVPNSVRENVSYEVLVADIFNNRPPAGSSVNVEGDGGCLIAGDFPVVAPNTTAPGAFVVPFTVSGASGDNPGSQTAQGCPVETGSGTVTISLDPTEGAPPPPEVIGCSYINNAPQPPQADPNNPVC